MIFHQRISNDKNGKAALSTENAGDIVKANRAHPTQWFMMKVVVFDAIKIDGDLAMRLGTLQILSWR